MGFGCSTWELVVNGSRIWMQAGAGEMSCKVFVEGTSRIGYIDTSGGAALYAP